MEDSRGQIDMGAHGAMEGQEDNIEDNRGQYILFIVFVPYQLIWGCCWRLPSIAVDWYGGVVGIVVGIYWHSCWHSCWPSCWRWLAFGNTWLVWAGIW